MRGEKDVHVICDNLSAHRTEEITEWLSNHKRFHLHFSPTHASWLNQVELWFGILGKKVLERGEFRYTEELAQKIMKFIELQQDRKTLQKDIQEKGTDSLTYITDEINGLRTKTLHLLR